MGERIKRADVANFIRSFKGGNFDQLTRRDGTGFFQKLQKAFVYNNTGATLEVGSPVYISGAMNDLPYEELVNEYLTSGFCLSGETYDADYTDRPIAFCLEPIEAGNVGECRIDGLTPAILTGYEDGLRYAKVNENTELLAQGDASDYQIVGVSDENEDGKRFAFVKPKSEKSWNCWIRTDRQPVFAGVIGRVDETAYFTYFTMPDGDRRRFTTEEAYNEFSQLGLVVGWNSANRFDNIPQVTALEDLPFLEGDNSNDEIFRPRYARAFCDERLIAGLVYVPPELRESSSFYFAKIESLSASEKQALNDFKTVQHRICAFSSKDVPYPEGQAQYIVLSQTKVETDPSSRFYGFSFCHLRPWRKQRFIRAVVQSVSSSVVSLEAVGADLDAGDTTASLSVSNWLGLGSQYVGGVVVLARNQTDYRTTGGEYAIISATLPEPAQQEPSQGGD